jgi:hypothetical protein
MYLETTSWASGCASYEKVYCPYWGYEKWTTWPGKWDTARLKKEVADPNCQRISVILLMSLSSNPWIGGRGIRLE